MVIFVFMLWKLLECNPALPSLVSCYLHVHQICILYLHVSCLFVSLDLKQFREHIYISFDISVFSVPPIITLPLLNQTVAEEHIVSFICKASGTPHPTFTWERKGKVINPRRQRYHVHSMPHGSVLRIDPVRAKDDNNLFACIASNDLGEPAGLRLTSKFIH